MNFPIKSEISPLPYGPKKIGVVLMIVGNAGQIPNAFQWTLLTAAPLKKDDPPQEGCDQGVAPMTDEQWDAWKDQDSETYILECTAENLGLTLVASSTAKPATTNKTRR